MCYSVSRQQQDKWRKAAVFPQLHEILFHYLGRELKATIQPALIKADDGTITGYYPSASEELVEDALRKIAAEQRQGYFDKPNYRSGVVFTLYLLRAELKKQGHTRSYQEIILSLSILAGSGVEIRAGDGKKGEGFTKSPFFPSLSASSRTSLNDDPQAKWIVQFHPLVTHAIDDLTYRQFNYAQMMSHSTQLARWLHKQLSLKFTFASIATTFEMRYSTIRRDSALLDGYGRTAKAVETLDAAFAELKAGRVLMEIRIRKNLVVGLRGKIEDVVYTFTPSLDFVVQAKAANKRVSANSEKTDIQNTPKLTKRR